MWKFRRSSCKLVVSLLFIVTLVTVLCSKEIPAVAQGQFRDLSGHWAQNCIESLVDRRIITGYPDQTFRPDATVTRAEFSVMLGKAIPTLKPIRTATAFQDVPSTHWAASAIQAAYRAGFLSGYPDRVFKPADSITRVQAIGSLAGGLAYKTQQPPAQTLQAYTDANQIPSYAEGAIAAASENHLVVNYPNVKQLRPNQPITRAELAASFCRVLPTSAQTVPSQYIAGAASATNYQQEVSQQEVPTAARQEIRGVWITNVDSQVMFDRATLANAVRDLAQMNFNTLYPTVWNWGYTQYPSAVAKRVIGSAVDPRPEALGLQGRDMLAEMIQQGHQNKMAVIPWFEFGFMVSETEPLGRIQPKWLTQRLDGSQIWMEGIYPRVWLNPFHPEVQQFIQELLLELVTKYDLDGIQLDDHWGLPAEFGYDPYTVALYQREHNGQSPPANPSDREWVRWRANKITEFTRRVFQAVKARKDNVLFTLSPNNYGFSLNHSLQDWLTWEREGLIEELVLQVYRNSLSAFVSELDSPEVQDARQHIPVGVGILTGLKDQPVSIQQVQKQVQAVRDRGFHGVSFFFYETMWNLTKEGPDQRKAAFRSFFSDRMPRPNIKQGWVPG